MQLRSYLTLTLVVFESNFINCQPARRNNLTLTLVVFECGNAYDDATVREFNLNIGCI